MVVLNDKCVVCGENDDIIPSECYTSKEKWVYICKWCEKFREQKVKNE